MTQRKPQTLRKLTNGIVIFGIVALTLYAIIAEDIPLRWMMTIVIALRITVALVVILTKKPFKFSSLVNYLGLLIVLCFFGYRIYKVQKKQNCQVNLGLPFNKERSKNGVPLLPDNWRKDDHYANWFKTGDGDGHNVKYVGLDIDNGGCQITFERDDYYLPAGDSARYVSVLTRYSKSDKPDAIIFNYYFGNSIKTVNRQFADSLLTAEHIRKDF